MNLSFFTTLNAVIHRGTFAAAAAECHLSPSAVSLQMKRLEEHFGQPLFDRSGPHANPTPFAHEVAGLTSAALEGLDALRRRSSPAIAGDVRIGIIDSMQALLMPEAMRHLKQRHPGVLLRPTRDKSHVLVNALKQGALDAVIVAQPGTARSRRLDWQLLMREEMVLIAPPLSLETTPAALMEAYEFIHFDRGTNLGVEIGKYLARQHARLKGTMELQSTQAVVAMVSAGMGVSIMFWPDRRLTVGFPLRELKLGPEAPALDIAFASRKADAENRAIAAVRDAFRQAVALTSRQ